ncbi:Leucine-rich repeat protein kinase family protein [Abeliophyllum distichum]|uniref:Leucine-rich repeat protein kinase family protein n=1 Tax=Abeliophyllum distichum TaxID=126358 RepID=A0ABD1VBC7_9LAMI
MGLVGKIKPDALVNLAELSILSFKNNSIHVNLMEFSYNPKLKNFFLSGNRFDGEIPSSLLELNFLESLQLQENNLAGSIPGFNQSSLREFKVSYNNLSGKIPHTGILQSIGLSSFVGNQDLCGAPTPTACSSLNDSSDPPNSNKKNPFFSSTLGGGKCYCSCRTFDFFSLFTTRNIRISTNQIKRKELCPSS